MKGRTRRQAKREKNGRASRAGVPRFDKGTERAQAMTAPYGQDGADAIGRAYRAGLLGQGSDAKALLDMARRISNAYWQAYETGRYACPLADRTHGTVAILDHQRIKRREEWLNDCLDHVRRKGPVARRAFYQLVIDVNPDCGPHFLDRLCFATRTNHAAGPGDQTMMATALELLRDLA